jgi:hypothetical protein
VPGLLGLVALDAPCSPCSPCSADPHAKEWAVLATRNLTAGNFANQKFIEGLEAMEASALEYPGVPLSTRVVSRLQYP